MAVFSKHRFYDGAVTSPKIMADTVVPADVDETQAFNFSGVGSSFAGVFAKTRIQAFKISIGATSTARSYPDGNFAATPIIFACQDSEATSSQNLFVNATSASSFIIYTGSAPAATSNSANVIAIDMS